MRLRVATLALATLFVCQQWDVGRYAAVKAQGSPERTYVRAQWTQQNIDLVALFDAVVETVNKKFFDEEVLKQRKWQERAQAQRPSVIASPTIDDAVRHINELLAELRTSHTALYTPDDYQYYILLDVLGFGFKSLAMRDLMERRFWGSGPFYPGIGVFTREVDGRSFVDGVLEGSPADKSGLRFGDEILSVDGRPYSPIAIFREKLGTTVELMVRRTANAEPERVKAAVIPIQPVKAFSDAAEASARVIERNGRRIGYVHVWALAESGSFEEALERFEPAKLVAESLELKGVAIAAGTRDEMRPLAAQAPKPIDFLVVDLRGRVGGNAAVVGQLLKTLEGGYLGNERTFSRSSRLMAGPQWPSFRGRSALLIDAHTRSAGEVMAYGYKRSGFGPLLGTTTAGAVSSGALYPMPGDALLYVAVAGHEFDGHRLEGAGVTPDYVIERPLPYAQGADPVLEAALDLLSNSSAK